MGDVTDFSFDIPPVDFCYSSDFGHLLTMEEAKKALRSICNHLREGGGLVIETTLPPKETKSDPLRIFLPDKQVYPGKKVWKTGEGRFDRETGRHYISQKFFVENEKGEIKSFDHSFYLQSYSREEWLAAFEACGFELAAERSSREVQSWQSGGSGFCMFEAIRKK